MSFRLNKILRFLVTPKIIFFIFAFSAYTGIIHLNSAWAQDDSTQEQSVQAEDDFIELDLSFFDSPPKKEKEGGPDEAGLTQEPSEAGTAATVVPSEEDGKEFTPVEINGDKVEFSMAENKVIASGDVSIIRNDVTLYCDKLEFFRETKIAIAEGNVILDREDGRIEGEKMQFNFDTMKGDFEQARMASKPFYGAGDKVVKVDENHMRLDRGYLTFCDHDKPHFRFATKKVDIYPGEKAVARNVRLLAGNIPLLYIPKFTQDLSDKKPAVLYTPGYDKDWGAFLLSNWRYKLNENLRGVVHLDYRQRKDFAWGIDVDYDTKGYGNGLIRTYYMNERNVNAKHFFEERTPPTIERERFKVEWRHKWNIDEETDAIWQYYKLSDNTILKDYFENEFDEDSNPESYFLLTRALTTGTLSFRTDVRVNRFVDAVERLPEISYDMPDTQIAKTGLYLSNKSTYSNLVKKTASPSEIRQQTMRFNQDNELSYPFKISFIELRPFVGGQQTFYTKTKDKTKYDVVRGIFKTGADLSTKFYRIYDIQTNKYGLDINRLRHIITPSVAYLYRHEPTMPNSQIDQFDGIDNLTQAHKITFSLENKLQTKRNGKSVDLVRLVLGSDFLLKEDLGKPGFNDITSDIEITPYDWLTFYFESNYSAQEDQLKTADVDVYLRGKNGKWYLNFGKRYNRAVDDQITTEWGYKINPKWYFRVYQRFDVDQGIHKEQEYTLTRDLHAWELDFSFNSTRGQGDEIWVVFSLKEFPDIGFDFGTSFNKRKPGSGPLD